MSVRTTNDLYGRGIKTLLSAWEEYARGATDAAIHYLPGVAAAVFPQEPERSVYNNAVFVRDLTAAALAEAIATMQTAYAQARVTDYAAWVHESDLGMRTELERRSYTVQESTRAMGMALTDLQVPRPQIDVGRTDWVEYLRIIGVPPDLLAHADHTAFHVLIARLDGENAAAGMAFDADGDCGIYNVVTLEHARGRGLATGLTALHLHPALARGCQTASLQSTSMAERVYAGVGFRDLGLILEYAPERRPSI